MKKFYYGWVIVCVGLLVKMAALGFGRFAYAMLLSSMRTSLAFTYIQMGLLSGGILLGYLIFSFVGGTLATKFGSKRVVVISLLCSSFSMVFISQLSSFVFLLFFTVMMGGAAGGAHISMTTLPMAWFDKDRLGRALGIVTGGTGLGVIVTGLLLPFFLSSLGKEAWRQCWIFLSLMTLAVAVTGWILLKEKPAVTPVPPSIPEKQVAPPKARRVEFSLQTLFFHYFVFGFAYNIYATYFVAYMVDEVHLSGGLAGLIWSVFGWTCLVSGLVWGSLSDRLGRGKALLWNNGFVSLAVLIPLLFQYPVLLGASAFLFGMTFLGTITIVAASVGDLDVEKKASVYGLITLVHGIGQFLGTTSGGYLKDVTGSFHLTLLSSLVGFVLCCILILLKRKG